MKKFLKKATALSVASLISLSTLTACGDSEPVSLSSFLSERDNLTSAYLSSGYEKILDESQFKYRSEKISLYAAKNESESCVVSVITYEDNENVSIEVGTCPSGVTTELFLEETLLIEDQLWPDPLVPLDSSVEIESDEIKNLLVRFNVSAKAVAGDYNVPIVVKNSVGDVTANLEVELHIWDFAYPEEPSLDTAFGLYNPGSYPEIMDGEDTEGLYKVYYDFMLDYKISAYDLPYDILDERADAYMSDPRVTSFVVPNTGNDELLKKYYDKLCSNPEWLEKACIYPLDEPGDKAAIERLQTITERIRRICPELRILCPFFVNFTYDETRDAIDVFAENMDILCAKLACFNDLFIYSEKDRETLAPFAERMEGYAEEGKDVWSYVCWEPGAPYTNLFVNEAGIDHRVLFWQQYLVESTGFLYWCSNYWNYTDDPWTNMATVLWLSPDIYGDGSVIYPGNKVGVYGPCGSVRLEAVRDGIEDYELFVMAEEVLGKDFVMDAVEKVTTSVTEFNDSVENFNETRIELGNALEEALKDQNK